MRAVAAIVCLAGLGASALPALPFETGVAPWDQTKALICADAVWTTCNDEGGCRKTPNPEARPWQIDFERKFVGHQGLAGGYEIVPILARDAACREGRCNSALFLGNHLLVHLFYSPIPSSPRGWLDRLTKEPPPKTLRAVVYNHRWGLSKIDLECQERR